MRLKRLWREPQSTTERINRSKFPSLSLVVSKVAASSLTFNEEIETWPPFESVHPLRKRVKKVPNHRKTEKRSLSLLPPFFSVITSSRNGQAGPANVRELYTVRVIDLLLLCVCTVLSYTKNPTAEDDVFVSDETRGNERHPSRSISTFFFLHVFFFQQLPINKTLSAIQDLIPSQAQENF